MKKNKKNSAERFSSGFNSLIGAYTEALEENSKDIADVLMLLQRKELKDSDRKALRSIKRALKKIDDTLNDLGEED